MKTTAENTPVNVGGKQNAGRFKPGQSGNPAGKPKGARHRVTKAVEALMDKDAEAITQKCIQLAKSGDLTAIRLVLERVDPVRKGKPVILPLPRIEKASDLVSAMAAVVDAMCGGEISPEEAATIAGIFEIKRKSIETMEHEERLLRLEKGEK